MPARDDRSLAFQNALLDLDQVAAAALLRGSAASGLDPDALEVIVVPALVHIGERWEAGELALSQVYMSGRTCERLIAEATAHEPDPPGPALRIGVAVIDDAHILGKQIVLQMLRSAGYQPIDLGARLSTGDIVEAVTGQAIDVLVLSVLMLRAALEVAEMRLALDAAGRRVVIVVGGAPFRFDASLGDEVGADYVGVSASDILPIMARIAASWGQPPAAEAAAETAQR